MVGPLLSPGITRRTFGRATPCARKYVSMASTFEFLVTTYARPCERKSETKSLSTARRRAAAASASGVRSLKFFGSGDAPAFVAHIVRSKSRKTQNAFVVSTSCATSSASPRETPHASHAARSHRRHARACGQKNPGGHAGDIGHRPASLAACSHNTHVDPTIHNFEYDRSHLPHRFVPSARVTRAAAAPSTRPARASSASAPGSYRSIVSAYSDTIFTSANPSGTNDVVCASSPAAKSLVRGFASASSIHRFVSASAGAEPSRASATESISAATRNASNASEDACNSPVSSSTTVNRSRMTISGSSWSRLTREASFSESRATSPHVFENARNSSRTTRALATPRATSDATMKSISCVRTRNSSLARVTRRSKSFVNDGCVSSRGVNAYPTTSSSSRAARSASASRPVLARALTTNPRVIIVRGIVAKRFGR